MPILFTEAGEVSDLDPARTTPDDMLLICAQAKMRLDQMGDHGVPLSATEAIAERIRSEVETIEQHAQRPEIRAGWQDEGHVKDFLHRMRELETEAYNAFLTDLEKLEDGNPLREFAARYQHLLELKRRGEIPGLIHI